jgi:hypothetical protein
MTIFEVRALALQLAAKNETDPNAIIASARLFEAYVVGSPENVVEQAESQEAVEPEPQESFGWRRLPAGL